MKIISFQVFVWKRSYWNPLDGLCWLPSPNPFWYWSTTTCSPASQINLSHGSNSFFGFHFPSCRLWEIRFAAWKTTSEHLCFLRFRLHVEACFPHWRGDRRWIFESIFSVLSAPLMIFRTLPSTSLTHLQFEVILLHHEFLFSLSPTDSHGGPPGSLLELKTLRNYCWLVA